MFRVQKKNRVRAFITIRANKYNKGRNKYFRKIILL